MRHRCIEGRAGNHRNRTDSVAGSENRRVYQNKIGNEDNEKLKLTAWPSRYRRRLDTNLAKLVMWW